MIQMQNSVWWMTRTGMCDAVLELIDVVLTIHPPQKRHKWAGLRVTALKTDKSLVKWPGPRPRNHPGEERRREAPGHQPGPHIDSDSSINNYPSHYKHHEPQRDRVWCLLTGNKSGLWWWLILLHIVWSVWSHHRGAGEWRVQSRGY